MFATRGQSILIENQRAHAILRELLRDGNITVEQMAKTFDVSASSIRRDLRELERAGLLRRTRGGAVLVEPTLYEPFRHLSSFGEQEQRCAAEKRRIGLAAAEMIADGEIVGIGAGTTTTQVARGIRHRKNITVVTNAVNIAMELSHHRDLKIFMAGGLLSSDWFALIGAAAIQSEVLKERCGRRARHQAQEKPRQLFKTGAPPLFPQKVVELKGLPLEEEYLKGLQSVSQSKWIGTGGCQPR